MNICGKNQSMFAVREHYRLQFGVNKSRTLAGLVGK